MNENAHLDSAFPTCCAASASAGDIDHDGYLKCLSPVVMRRRLRCSVSMGWMGHLFFTIFDSLTALMNNSNGE